MALGNRRKQFRYEALLNAAAMISDHGAGGLEPSDIGLEEDDEKGLVMYLEECKVASRRIETMAAKFKASHNL